MELLAASASAGAHAAKRAAARCVDAGGRAGVHEAATRPRAAEPWERHGLPGQAGRQKRRQRRAAQAAIKGRPAHGLTRASAIGLASFAGVKVNVSAANVALVVQDSVAS
jgi:hypothetical protein